jgi:hypothetical protein
MQMQIGQKCLPFNVPALPPESRWAGCRQAKPGTADKRLIEGKTDG